jgi:hypothetical protein
MFECSSASAVIPSPLLLTLNAHLHRLHDPVSAFSVIFTVLTLHSLDGKSLALLRCCCQLYLMPNSHPNISPSLSTTHASLAEMVGTTRNQARDTTSKPAPSSHRKSASAAKTGPHTAIDVPHQAPSMRQQTRSSHEQLHQYDDTSRLGEGLERTHIIDQLRKSFSH